MPPPILSSTPSKRACLQNFTSLWFLIPQGTGIIAVVLYQLDYQFDGLKIISYIFWIMSMIFLFSTLLIFLLRCIFFPRKVAIKLREDISELCCLTSIPIAYTSVIQMMSLVLVQRWGSGWGMATYILWWINVVMAVVGTVGILFVVVRLYPSGLPHLSPASQLPLISALTAAAGGGTICQYAMISSQLQVPVIVVSYLLLGVGLPLAFALDVPFWARLLDRSSPSPQHTFQDMILCGPWGQGSFALQALAGAVLHGSFASYGHGSFLTAQAAGPVGYVSIFAGLLAWGLGTFWWIFAIISILHGTMAQRRFGEMQYDLAAWSVVFPWGVYSNSAVQLGKLLDSAAFKIWSTALTIMLVITWLLNIIMTTRGTLNGSLLRLDQKCKSYPPPRDEAESNAEIVNQRNLKKSDKSS